MSNIANTLAGDTSRWNAGLGIEGIERATVVKAPDMWMGGATALPFEPSWLYDYQGVLEHVYTEHALHVKGVDEYGVGLTWDKRKFTAASDTPDLNPERHCQMRLGYFLVPEEHMKALQTEEGVRSGVQEQLMVEVQGRRYYRFFVHPDAYPSYAHLEGVTQILRPEDPQTLASGKELYFVRSEDSPVMGTPSSSYRSWVVRDINAPRSETVPFVVKMGVPCFVLGSDRWLSDGEIERSVMCQRAFDRVKENCSPRPGAFFRVFNESMGLNLNHPIYRKGEVEGGKPVKPSGNLIREFPEEVLRGEWKVASCAALMSVEPSRGGTEPWIFTLAKAAIARGEVKTVEEFLKKHFIDDFMEAVSKVIFEEGLTLEPHSQNLCVLLSPENDRILGFAYRDHGGVWVDLASRVVHDKPIDFLACGMTRDLMQGSGLEDVPDKTTTAGVLKAQGAIEKAYIQCYAWFYRYQVLTKMVNALIVDSSHSWTPPGAPYQIDPKDTLLEERVLTPYWQGRVQPLTRLRTPSSPMEEEISRSSLAMPTRQDEWLENKKRLSLNVITDELDTRSKPWTPIDSPTSESASSADDSAEVLGMRDSPVAMSSMSMAAVAERIDTTIRPDWQLTLSQAQALLREADLTYVVRYLSRHFIIGQVHELLSELAKEVGAMASDRTEVGSETMPERIARIVQTLKVEQDSRIGAASNDAASALGHVSHLSPLIEPTSMSVIADKDSSISSRGSMDISAPVLPSHDSGESKQMVEMAAATSVASHNLVTGRSVSASTLDRLMLPAAEGGSGHEASVSGWHHFFGSWRLNRELDQSTPKFFEPHMQRLFAKQELIVSDRTVAQTLPFKSFVERRDATLFFNDDGQLVAVLPRILEKGQ